MSFRRLAYDNPDLGRLQDAVSRSQREQDARPNFFYGRPTNYVRGDYRARFGDQAIVKPTDGTSTIYLPRIAKADIGLPVVVSNASSLRTNIVVRPPPGVLIGGDSSAEITEPYDSMVFVAVTESLYLTKVSASATGAATPIWEWNGTDTSQFGTLTYGSGVTACSISVVSALGDNWLQVSHEENSGVGAYYANKMVFVPIEADIGVADYRIEAEAYCATKPGTGGDPGTGLACRFDDTAGTTTPGAGVVGVNVFNHVDGRRMLLTTATADSDIRKESGSTFPMYDTTDLDHLSLSVNHETICRFSSSGIDIGSVSSSAPTTEQKAGLATIVYGASNPTSAGLYRYRNIKIWAN